ncbi:hypothetical protein PISMIDRAFT_13943 [Pisolithus microcarpus 441]|uniref:Uncharacterized protein n=1 Tax=Pisolithus microcarpus 441 TaxID=765257 RepID=A0A0C9Y2X1_9AGAM|nr:hypothetical protein BKA83DRAFT_13943 [Pisolithus microcarpus]KIK19045.1 hypothetical protein PISMIDRAFT_13943 [Pisolithus microcarpus 441]
MASERVTRHVSVSEGDEAYFTVDSIGEDEENPVTQSKLQLFKETIQLELDGAVSAINEAANTVKAHLGGVSLGAHGNAGDQETLPLLRCKVKGLPAHRQPADLEFQKLICEHALALMKHENKHSLFANVPSKLEVTAYTKGTQQPCCTADNFRVDLNNTPASTWNMSASHVFAASFHDTHPGCGRSLKTIFNAWVVHFNYLCQVYVKQQMVAREEQARITNIASRYANKQDHESPLAGIRSVHRCQERKLQLYNRRLRTAQCHSGSYPSAVNVVQQLGPARMSSDESEHDVGHGELTYHITPKAWQSRSVMETLQVLDTLHLWMRYQQQWNVTTGAWPHLCVPSSRLSNREPLLGLPKNFYAQDYLSSLTAEGLDGLLLQDDIPLDIPSTIAA